MHDKKITNFLKKIVERAIDRIAPLRSELLCGNPPHYGLQFLSPNDVQSTDNEQRDPSGIILFGETTPFRIH